MASPMVIRIAADLKEFRANMAEMKAQLETNASAMKRMASSFDGSRLISDANAMAKSIHDIGGASKLTEAEQRRVNATVTAALDKYKALGRDAPKELLELKAATEQVERTTEGFGARVTGLVAAAAAAKQAISQVVSVVGDWISSSGAQEDAAVRLDTALRAQGTYTPELSAQYADLASQFQKTTVFSDELVQEMSALLVQVGDVMPKDMDRALQASTDLAAGLRIDLKTATQLVGKAFAGETGTLKRYGIVIDEAKLKTEGVSAVMDAIADKMGGQASAQAKTFTGQMQQMGNVIDDVKEILGQIISDAIMPMARAFMAIPEPLRTGMIAFGLVATAVGALSIAIGGLIAAAKLALPMLGVTMPASLTTLSGAATAASGAMTTFWGSVALPVGIVSGAIAAVVLMGDKLRELAGVSEETAQRLAQSRTGLRDGSDQIGAAYRREQAAAKELGEQNHVLASSYLSAQRTAEINRIQRLKDEQVAAAEAAKELAAAQKIAEAEAKKLAKAFQSQVDVLTGRALAKEVAELSRQIEAAGKQGGLTAHQLDLMGKKLVALQESGASLPPELQRIAFEFEDTHRKGLPVATTSQSIATAFKAVKATAMSAVPSVSQLRLELQGFGRDFQQAGLPGVSDLDNVKRYFAGLVPAAKNAGTKSGESFAESFAKAISGLGSVIVGAIQGGGDIGRAMGAHLGNSLGSSLAESLSKDAGKWTKAFASFLGPLGSLAGSFIGGAVDKLFKSNDTKKDREAAASMLGFSSLAAMNRELNKLGAEGAALAHQGMNLIGKKDTAANEAWIKSVEQLFAKTKQGAADALAATQALRAEAQAMIPNWETAGQLAEKYGIDLSTLGDKFKQGGLSAATEELYLDFQKLAAFIGEDMNEGVLRGMADEVSALVERAKAFGGEIPNQMKPMILKLQEMGLLLDENGNTIEGIENLKFGETMQETTKTLIEVMKELAATIRGAVGGALDDIAAKAKGIAVPNFAGVSFGGGLTPAVQPRGDFAGSFASGGDVVAHRPTWALFGEAGPERATFTPLGRGAGGGGTVQIIFNNPSVRKDSDIRELTRQVAHALPRYLDLIGVRG